jgi:predicted nucleic acid-binding Zn ribbon protein
MPTYEYHCPSNNRIVEVSHKIAEKLSTWGELSEHGRLSA